jgi:hypothetical protein
MNKAMIGTFGVGIVIVDGPAGSPAKFTDDEKFAVQRGFNDASSVLYALAQKFTPKNPPSGPAASAHLVFMANRLPVVQLSLDPTTVPAPTGRPNTDAEYEQREAPWRDAALKILLNDSNAAGAAAVDQYVNNMLDPNQKVWSLGTPPSAFAIFVTKYNTAWLAYKKRGHPFIVIQYPWVIGGDLFGIGASGFGLDGMRRVLAHEIGHIVSAPDEYKNSHCHVSDQFGVLNVKNGNCQQDDDPNPNAKCLMNANTPDVLCDFTVQTFGWVDADHDGKLDVQP